MTTCIKCGKPVADGELFCAQCSLNPGLLDFDEPAQSPAPRPHPSAGRMQKPVPAPRPKAVARQPVYAPRKEPPRLRGPLIAVSVLCALLAALCAWQIATRARANVSLRVREAALDERAHTMDELQLELTAREEELQNAEAAIASLQDQVDLLQANIDAAESTMSQTQYDMTTQQAQLEVLQKKNDQLTEDAQAMQEAIDSLTEQNLSLTQTNEGYQKQIDFMDAYVVFVEDDGTGHYHHYDCPYFTQRSFWAYSRKLAEKNNYTPCPHCFG